MSDGSVPVTVQDCKTHTDSIFAALKWKMSVKQWAITVFFFLLIGGFMINWLQASDKKMDVLAADAHAIKAVDVKLGHALDEQRQIRAKVDDTHDAVIRLETLIKKNGNH